MIGEHDFGIGLKQQPLCADRCRYDRTRLHGGFDDLDSGTATAPDWADDEASFAIIRRKIGHKSECLDSVSLLVLNLKSVRTFSDDHELGVGNRSTYARPDLGG